MVSSISSADLIEHFSRQENQSTTEGKPIISALRPITDLLNTMLNHIEAFFFAVTGRDKKELKRDFGMLSSIVEAFPADGYVSMKHCLTYCRTMLERETGALDKDQIALLKSAEEKAVKIANFRKQGIHKPTKKFNQFVAGIHSQVRA